MYVEDYEPVSRLLVSTACLISRWTIFAPGYCLTVQVRLSAQLGLTLVRARAFLPVFYTRNYIYDCFACRCR